jgi:large subunit ribosomal protein L20
MLHALSYSFAHRRKKKGDMRRLWILRINAAARENGLTYSQLISGLTEIGSSINRKVLAEMALRDPESFSQIVDQVRGEVLKPTS